jgi:hypothetical protein
VSILAVTQLAGQAIIACYQYRAAVKSTTDDMNKIMTELDSLQGIFEHLYATLATPESKAESSLQKLENLSKLSKLIVGCNIYG